MTTNTIKAGCKFHDDCFTCLFPDCLEGSGRGVGKFKLQLQAKALSSQGLVVTQIAQKLGKSERTIQRYLNDN